MGLRSMTFYGVYGADLGLSRAFALPYAMCWCDDFTHV